MHRIGGNLKHSGQSQIARNKFSIAICRQSGDKQQSKTVSNSLWSTFLDIINVFDFHLSGVFIDTLNTYPKQSETRARNYLHFHVSVEKTLFPHRIGGNWKSS